MFRSNAGKQCVAMSLCSIVYNEIKSVNIWDTSTMNQILVYGNNLYIVRSPHIHMLIWLASSETYCSVLFRPLGTNCRTNAELMTFD